MSLRVNGFPCSSFSSSTFPRTVLSSRFFHHIGGHYHGPRIAIALDTPEGPFTIILDCYVAAEGPDICLGLDWKAYMHELFLSLNRQLPYQFDPFSYYWSSEFGLYQPSRKWLLKEQLFVDKGE
ncbi:hypothetical protein C8F04DRAFT_1197407 [Mycena alexandri]|uniref:Uncharacterized protein n=1 Tax=Mycena alexandri TaxID=1745969 RepID=A0AAD6WSX7_9AGAR|nr:hypothetical protein C8F04DRAFT_1197407 [Mycena alexandri]